MPLIESFTIDHRTMKAPQIRKAKTIKREKTGEILEVYDLRFIKPNVENVMTPKGMHSLEHLLATFMRDELTDIVDISPMGCRTGFYMSIFGEHNEKQIETALVNSLKVVLNAENIPGATEIECGNYKEHSLEEAKNIAQDTIKGFENAN